MYGWHSKEGMNQGARWNNVHRRCQDTVVLHGSQTSGKGVAGASCPTPSTSTPQTAWTEGTKEIGLYRPRYETSPSLEPNRRRTLPSPWRALLHVPPAAPLLRNTTNVEPSLGAGEGPSPECCLDPWPRWPWPTQRPHRIQKSWALLASAHDEAPHSPGAATAHEWHQDKLRPSSGIFLEVLRDNATPEALIFHPRAIGLSEKAGMTHVDKLSTETTQGGQLPFRDSCAFQSTTARRKHRRFAWTTVSWKDIIPGLETLRACTDHDDMARRNCARAASSRLSASIKGSQSHGSLSLLTAWHSQAHVECDRSQNSVSSNVVLKLMMLWKRDRNPPSQRSFSPRELQHDAFHTSPGNTQWFVIAPQLQDSWTQSPPFSCAASRQATAKTMSICFGTGENALDSSTSPLPANPSDPEHCPHHSSHQPPSHWHNHDLHRGDSSIDLSNVSSSTQLGRWIEQKVNPSQARRPTHTEWHEDANQRRESFHREWITMAVSQGQEDPQNQTTHLWKKCLAKAQRPNPQTQTSERSAQTGHPRLCTFQDTTQSWYFSLRTRKWPSLLGASEDENSSHPDKTRPPEAQFSPWPQIRPFFRLTKVLVSQLVQNLAALPFCFKKDSARYMPHIMTFLRRLISTNKARAPELEVQYAELPSSTHRELLCTDPNHRPWHQALTGSLQQKVHGPLPGCVDNPATVSQPLPRVSYTFWHWAPNHARGHFEAASHTLTETLSVPESWTPLIQNWRSYSWASQFRNSRNTDLVSLFITTWWKQSSGSPGSSLILWWMRLPLSPWTTIASGFPEALRAYSGEVSNFCNSPSSRSEPGMLSIDSSKCIWDWSRDRLSFVPGFAQIPSLLQNLVDLVLQILSVHRKLINVFQRTSRNCCKLLGRKHFGLITCGTVRAQVSGTLVIDVRECFF